jgi:hypothetical protein
LVPLVAFVVNGGATHAHHMRAHLMTVAIVAASGCWVSNADEFAHEYAERYCRIAARCNFDPGLETCERDIARSWLERSDECDDFDVTAARRCIAAWDDRVEDAICSLGEPPDCLEVFADCEPSGPRPP